MSNHEKASTLINGDIRLNKLIDGGAFFKEAVKQAKFFHDFREANPDASISEFWRLYDLQGYKEDVKREEEDRRRRLERDLEKIEVHHNRIEFGEFSLQFSYHDKDKVCFLRLKDRDTRRPLTKWVKVEVDSEGYFSYLWRNPKGNPIKTVLEDHYGPSWWRLLR